MLSEKFLNKSESKVENNENHKVKEMVVIKVTDLSKSYQIYKTPRDRLKQFVVPRIQRLIQKPQSQYYNDYWALKNISFDIKKGDTVGIIGRNGSGKSTLLQIICGMLSPTSGSVQTYGRISALLELGSGFNPEFTGRENVYMNAAVLGLRKDEIDSRFKDIIDFADIGDFIEQPVKIYSSGMMIRLAFSVIVHVDADILIVDEALSVGDAFFTQKCMLHIKKMLKNGVTLLFVSHDTGAVKSLCSNSMMIEYGKKICMGETGMVIDKYYDSNIQKQNVEVLPTLNQFNNKSGISYRQIFESNKKFQHFAQFQRIQNNKAEFLNVQLLDENKIEIEHVEYEQTVILRMVFRVNESLTNFGLGYHVRNKNGFDVVYSDTSLEKYPLFEVRPNEIYMLDWQFQMALQEGDYTVSAMFSLPIDLDVGKVEVCDFVPIAAQVRVSKGQSLPIYGTVHWKNNIIMHKFC